MTIFRDILNTAATVGTQYLGFRTTQAQTQASNSAAIYAQQAASRRTELLIVGGLVVAGLFVVTKYG